MELNSDELRFIERDIYPLLGEQGRNLSKIISRWQSLVEEVEEGYVLDKLSYENDIYSREVIEKILSDGPKSLVEKVQLAIQDYDRRFLQATWETKRPLYPDAEVGRAWWLFRLPLKLPEGYFRSSILSVYSEEVRDKGISYDA